MNPPRPYDPTPELMERTDMYETLLIQYLIVRARSLAADLTGDERGSDVIEKVIITAIFAALALGVGSLIVSKVTAKANSINLN